MKQNLFYSAAAAALVLTACSTSEEMDIPQNHDAISFGVTAANSTRAVESFCNSNLPKSFKVTALKHAAKDVYFESDVITGSGNPVKYTSNTERYWPQYNLDFHAHVNGDGFYNYTDGVAQFQNFKVQPNVQDQVDLLYAVKNDQMRQTVKLNFHHALSQVVFRAVNNSNLDVEVKGVSVGNVRTGGTYTFPKLDTDPNYENHGNGNLEPEESNRGEWAGVDVSELTRYDVTFDSKKIGSEAIDLTGISHNGNVDNSLLLMPQTTAAWHPGATKEYDGAYFLVNVKISYKQEDNGNLIYEGDAAIPVDIDWEEGVRYIYTFKFLAGGTGGYIPDPSNPQPVLEGITYDITTDDFIPVTKDENMEGGKELLNYASITMNNGEGATPENNSVQGSSYSEIVSVTLPSAPTRPGYEFINWTDKEENVYKPRESYELNAGETLTITANWEKVPEVYTYTLKFNANAQDGTLAVTGMPAELTVTSSEDEYTFTIPEADPKHGNYKFSGWGLKKKNYADDKKYKAGETVTLSKDKPSLELFAVWGVKMIVDETTDPEGSDF